MRHNRAVLLIFLVFLLLAVGGCYTVLRHPTGPSVVTEGTHYKSCSDCHADAVYYHPYYHYGSSHRRWSRFYGDPWWYDDYWWYRRSPYGGSGDGTSVESGRRHLWSKSGWASGGWGFRRPPSQQAPPQSEQEPKKETPKSDETKDDKQKQHIWKPRKKGF